MDDWFDNPFIVTGRIILIGLLAIGLCIEVNFYLIENVRLRVFMDGKEVYHGRSACVKTESIGSSSRVDTKKGFGCMFPKEYFAGHDLVIKTEHDDSD